MPSISGLATLLASRRARVPLAVIIVIAPILALVPHMRSLILRNAVLTAFVYTARAPIAGRVSSLPPRSGTVVTDGRAAAFVEDPRVDDVLVNDLRSRQNAQKEVLARVEGQLKRVDELEKRYTGQLDAYHAGFSHDTDQRIATARADVQSLDARLVDERNKAARARSLHEQGFESEADRDAAVASLEATKADRDSKAAELARLEAVKRELGEGRMLTTGLDDAVRLEGELATLRLQKLELETARTRAKSELAAVSARLEPAEKRYGLVHRAPVEVPDGVVVFRIHTYEGEHVEAGAPVFSFVDCKDLLLDMRVDDSVLSLVKDGQVARFRIFGSLKGHVAHAALVRGSAAVIGTESLATVVPRGTRDGQVLSRVDGDAELGKGMDFCGVGRTAYAKLEGVGLYRELLRRLFL